MLYTNLPISPSRNSNKNSMARLGGKIDSRDERSVDGNVLDGINVGMV